MNNQFEESAEYNYAESIIDSMDAIAEAASNFYMSIYDGKSPEEAENKLNEDIEEIINNTELDPDDPDDDHSHIFMLMEMSMAAIQKMLEKLNNDSKKILDN
jgi:hypothetical protein